VKTHVSGLVQTLYYPPKCFASGNVEWDELGSEASENAKIWYIYNAESAKIDASTTEGLNRGIDVLLVFVSYYVLWSVYAS